MYQITTMVSNRYLLTYILTRVKNNSKSYKLPGKNKTYPKKLLWLQL